MPCSLVLAPPTLNTMTATHAIQPTFIINESDYKVKILIEYSVYFFIESTSTLSISRVNFIFNIQIQIGYTSHNTPPLLKSGS